MIGAQEDAADYRAFEEAITADYDAQSAVERELVLRLASLLWRLRRAAAIETGLFEVQADRLDELGQGRHPKEIAGDTLHSIFAVRSAVDADYGPARTGMPRSERGGRLVGSNNSGMEGAAAMNPVAALARCFLRLANQPNFALDRLNRYEASLWRQVAQTLFALDALERRKPQERRRRFDIAGRRDLPSHEGEGPIFKYTD